MATLPKAVVLKDHLGYELGDKPFVAASIDPITGEIYQTFHSQSQPASLGRSDLPVPTGMEDHIVAMQIPTGYAHTDLYLVAYPLDKSSGAGVYKVTI